MKKDSRILVAGEDTMEGKALVQQLQQDDYGNITNLIESEPKLEDQNLIKQYFNKLQPEYIFLFAGKSGGIKVNQEMPAALMLDNLRIISNILSSAHESKVEKLLYLASSCVYPKHAKQPMCPEMLMTGPLEPTNSAYATAKLAGIELCRAYRKEYGDNFISVIPANVFGPGDDFSAENSHVVAGLMRRMHEAKLNGDRAVTIWGTGKPKREFIFVDDLAAACVFLMKRYNEEEPVNIGSGSALSISDLAGIIKEVTGYDGCLEFDNSRPDGMPGKVLDSSRLFSLGWESPNSFDISVERTYISFVSEHSKPVEAMV